MRPADLVAAVERLAAALSPEEVILFGSRAYGMPRPDSDADLLVVLPPGSERTRAIAARAGAIVRDGGTSPLAADVLAYTPAELAAQLAAGNTAVRDALAQGLVLYPASPRSRYAEAASEWSPSGAVRTWLRLAHDDLRSAKALASLDPPPWQNVVFHAQQAVEKALKGAVFHFGGRAARTHDLGELVVHLADLNRDAALALVLAHGRALAEMSRFAVEPRYGEGVEITPAIARAAVATAAGVFERVVGWAGGAGYGIG